MKQFIFLSLLVLLITQTFAVSNSQASNNSSQPIILLGEINDQSVGAESYIHHVPAKLKQAIQEQSKISATYDQKQQEIEEEEDEEFDDMGMGYGMFGDPYGGYGFDSMYAAPTMVIPITNTNDMVNQKPSINPVYESQLKNGDILFKQ